MWRRPLCGPRVPGLLSTYYTGCCAGERHTAFSQGAPSLAGGVGPRQQTENEEGPAAVKGSRAVGGQKTARAVPESRRVKGAGVGAVDTPSRHHRREVALPSFCLCFPKHREGEAVVGIVGEEWLGVGPVRRPGGGPGWR